MRWRQFGIAATPLPRPCCRSPPSSRLLAPPLSYQIQDRLAVGARRAISTDILHFAARVLVIQATRGALLRRSLDDP